MSLKNKLATTLLSTAVGLAASFGAVTASADQSYVTIGTGGQTGVYYVVGQSICRLVNRGTEDHGVKCTAPSTGGSVANINAIRQGQQDMGMTQSDWQFHALNGSKHDSFVEQGKFEDLRRPINSIDPIKGNILFSLPPSHKSIKIPLITRLMVAP